MREMPEMTRGGMPVCRPPVFFSWSGMRAGRFCRALRNMMEATLDGFRPWMSELDIRPGADWRSQVQSALNSSAVGIVALTPENYRSPWLLYEAGRMDGRNILVIPVRVCLPEVLLPRHYPLANQAVQNDEQGVLEIISTLNDQAEHRVKADVLKRRFDVAWEIHSADLEDPSAVLRAKDAEQQRFCTRTFLDIERASMFESACSLNLLIECSRIIVLTDWHFGFALCNVDSAHEGTEQVGEMEEVREALARELSSLQCMLHNALADEHSRSAGESVELIKRIVNACDRIHLSVKDRILPALQKAVNRRNGEQTSTQALSNDTLQRVNKLVKMVDFYNKVRGALEQSTEARPEGAALEKALRKWCGSLPAVAEEEPGEH